MVKTEPNLKKNSSKETRETKHSFSQVISQKSEKARVASRVGFQFLARAHAMPWVCHVSRARKHE